MIQANKQLSRSPFDLDRSRRDLPQIMPVMFKLMKVTSSTLISGSDKRYLYTVVEASIDTGASYAPALSVNTGSYDALSISELTNSTTVGTYSYGVMKTNLPTGFNAVAIPNGTYVLCVPGWRTDSSSIYLIVNTQAIDGTCP